MTEIELLKVEVKRLRELMSVYRKFKTLSNRINRFMSFISRSPNTEIADQAENNLNRYWEIVEFEKETIQRHKNEREERNKLTTQ